jgi:uncharacterized membrane protein
MTLYTNKTFEVQDYELQQASNAYTMALVSVIAGLPLPIVNVIASLIYYATQSKSSYFVRWHCIQAILAQTIMLPFNSLAFGWTLKIIFTSKEPSLWYFTYLFSVVLFNVIEFISVLITAASVRKGIAVRWFIVANITDSITSKQNRDPFRI